MSSKVLRLSSQAQVVYDYFSQLPEEDARQLHGLLLKPFVAIADDYHGFHTQLDILKSAGFSCDYHELGCGLSSYHAGGWKVYHAVVFLKGTKSTKEVRGLIREVQKELDSEDE